MSVSIATLSAHPDLGENTSFVLVGFIFVILVLAILALLTLVVGKVMQQFEKPRETSPLKSSTAPSVASKATPATPPAAARPADSDDVPPHVLALIAAATHVVLGGRPQRIVGVRRVSNAGWAQEGRREIFSSHRIR